MPEQRKFIPNEARIMGTVEKIDIRDKATSLDVNVNGTVIKTMVFSKAINIVRNIKEGDCVILDATLQSNNANTGFPALTIAVNHIFYGNSDKTQPAAQFRIAGRPIAVNRLSDERATALISTEHSGRVNNIRVYYEGTKEQVDNFCSLNAANYISLHGKFTGETNSMYVSSWRHMKPFT